MKTLRLKKRIKSLKRKKSESIDSPMNWKRNLGFWLISFSLIAFDQISKLLVLRFLKDKSSYEFIPRILEFRYAENTGIAFSLFSDYPFLLTILVTVIVLGISVYLLRISFLSSELNLFWAFIFAGACGNLIDRYIHGYVIDFINPLFIDFAIFNLADVFLNIGIVLMFFRGFLVCKTLEA